MSLPERHYDLAGELLAAALVEAPSDTGERPRAVLDRRAFARRRGAGGRGRWPAPAAGEALLRRAGGAGFEPRADDGGMALANCPFHVLAREHTELVCGMNLQPARGRARRVAGAGLVAPACEPEPGRCCVRLEPAIGA